MEFENTSSKVTHSQALMLNAKSDDCCELSYRVIIAVSLQRNVAMYRSCLVPTRSEWWDKFFGSNHQFHQFCGAYMLFYNIIFFMFALYWCFKYNFIRPSDTLWFFMKVVATVAFGMGLDKRDVGAVRLMNILCFSALICMNRFLTILVFCIQSCSDSLILIVLLLHGNLLFMCLMLQAFESLAASETIYSSWKDFFFFF